MQIRIGQAFRFFWALACAVFLSTMMQARSQPVAYLGGDVIASPEVVVVFWGNQPQGRKEFVQKFYNLITRSTYFDPLKEYGRPGKTIGAVKVVKTVSIAPGDTRSVDTLTVAREIDGLILRGDLPFPNEHTVYMLHFGPAVTPLMGANLFGIPIGAPPSSGSFCSYHFTARTQFPSPVPSVYFYGPKIRMSVIVDPSIGNCTSGPIPDAVTSFASHELIETITNPESVIVEMAPVIGAMLQCNGIFLPIGAAVPIPPFTPPPMPVINGQAPWAWARASSPMCNSREIADSPCGSRTFATNTQPEGRFTVSQYFLNSIGSCTVSTAQGTVPNDPPPPVRTPRQQCLDGCTADQKSCMAIAHTIAERGRCTSEAKTCRAQCP